MLRFRFLLCIVQECQECYHAAMDDHITELQIKFSYLEDEAAALNKIVTAQQSLVDALERKVRALEKRIEELEEEGKPDRRPPHY